MRFLKSCPTEEQKSVSTPQTAFTALQTASRQAAAFSCSQVSTSQHLCWRLYRMPWNRRTALARCSCPDSGPPDRQRLRVSGFCGVLPAVLPEARDWTPVGIPAGIGAFQGPTPGEADPIPSWPDRGLPDLGRSWDSEAQPSPTRTACLQPNSFIDTRLLPETGPGPSVPLEERILVLGCTCL